MKYVDSRFPYVARYNFKFIATNTASNDVSVNASRLTYVSIIIRLQYKNEFSNVGSRMYHLDLVFPFDPTFFVIYGQNYPNRPVPRPTKISLIGGPLLRSLYPTKPKAREVY